MTSFKRSSNVMLLAAALTIGLAANVPVQGQASLQQSSTSRPLPTQLQFTPPTPEGGTPRPRSVQGGGTRGDEDTALGCSIGEQSPTALVPSRENGSDGLGLTVAEYPTVFWYMPTTSASVVRFELSEEDNTINPIYSAEYELAESVKSSPGIMSITLRGAKDVSPLKIGQVYSWKLSLVCDPSDPTNTVEVMGKLKRVAPDPSLARAAQQATLPERVVLYANNGIWYDTLNALVELKMQSSPDAVNTDAWWNSLLTSVGLETIAEEPMF